MNNENGGGVCRAAARHKHRVNASSKKAAMARL
jgi:hypothetical protein